jgi:hypothetical protein
MYVVNSQAVRPPVWIFLAESISNNDCRPKEKLKFIQNLCMNENVCHVSVARYAAWMRKFQGCRFERSQSVQ